MSSLCGLSREPRANKSVDTDVLSTGFASLLSAGHFRRWASGTPRRCFRKEGAVVKFKQLALLASVWGFTFIPFAPAAAQQCSRLAAVDYASHEGTVQRLRQLYRESNFSQLEETLTCLMRSPQRFQSGKTGASAVYWLFRREMPAPGVDPSALSHLSKWKEQQPQSVFVRFAELRLRYAMAWNDRGSDFARNVPAEGWRLFNEKLAQTEQAILAAPAQLKNSPILQNLHLAVVQDMSESKTSPRAVFEEGVRRWPDYYDFYEVALTRLVPKWGGSWDAVDAFIAHWNKHLAKTEGNSMYARLYMSVISTGANPGETRISWPQLKSSLEELVSRYPDATHKNLAASYACGYQDVAYLKSALQRIRKEQLNPSVWLQGTDPETCTRMAGSVPP